MEGRASPDIVIIDESQLPAGLLQTHTLPDEPFEMTKGDYYADLMRFDPTSTAPCPLEDVAFFDAAGSAPPDSIDIRWTSWLEK